MVAHSPEWEKVRHLGECKNIENEKTNLKFVAKLKKINCISSSHFAFSSHD
jgi:hypothetical protein